MNKKLRYAVVGLGHGVEHVEAIMGNPREELVLCCDLNEETFRKANLPPEVQFTTNIHFPDAAAFRLYHQQILSSR